MQTADEIQVALLCVQICVGVVQVVTTCFFIRSVGITQRQEEDARKQILLAQKQTELMATQYRESLRPLIVVTLKQAGTNVHELEFRNEGMGPALKVECNPSLEIRGTLIGSKSSIQAYVKQRLGTDHPKGQLFNVTYKSLEGESYTTAFYQEGEAVYVVDYRHFKSAEDIELATYFREGFAASKGI